MILPVHSSTPVEKSFSSDESFITPIGKQLEMNYAVHELPGEDSISDCPSTLSSSVTECSSAMSNASSQATEVLVSTALLARIEILEVENHCLR